MIAPSKLQRPTGDRCKTDARDALHLARMLRLDEIVEVTVPSVKQAAARDLVRAREDVRVIPCAAKKTWALLMKSLAVAAVSLSRASVYARRLLPSIAECR